MLQYRIVDLLYLSCLIALQAFAQRALILVDFKIVFVHNPIGPGHRQLYADYVNEFSDVDSTSMGDYEEYYGKVKLMATQKQR